MSRQVVGILRMAQSDIALDAASLAEVVRLEAPLAPRPLAPCWSLGTLTLRQSPIPVIDLGRLLGLDPSKGRREAGDFVAIVEYHGARIGMRIDHVQDVVNTTAEQWHPLAESDGKASALTPRLLQHPDFDRPIYDLDLDVLFALEGMVAVRHRAAAIETAQAVANASSVAERWLVIDSHGVELAVDARVVREVAVCGEIDAPVIELPGYLGNTTLRDATLPLFDPRALIGLPDRHGRPSHLVVLESEAGPLTLAVDRIDTLISPRGALTPAGADQGPAIAGVVSLESDRDALAIDHHWLFSHLNLTALARLHTRLGGAAQRRRAAVRWKRFAFVHFDCGGDYVTLLEQLEAIDSAPTTMSCHVEPTPDNPFIGRSHHQSRSVSLVDLRWLLRRDASRPASHVLIVDTGNGLVGFLVDDTRRIAYVEAPEESLVIRWRGDARPSASAIERTKRLVAVGEGDKRQILALLCLQSLARDLMNLSEAAA